MDRNMGRREALKLSGLGLLALFGVSSAEAQEEFGQIAPKLEPNQIRVANNYADGTWYFDPMGMYVEKGTKVTWLGRSGTVTAFHPANDNHELRIPEGAKPFDSGVVPIPGRFEWTFDVEGTYDFFSRYQETIGMVGRIVVGQPGGPAEKNGPGYGGRDGRAVVYPNEVKVFAAIPSSEIMAKKAIRYSRQILGRPKVVGLYG